MSWASKIGDRLNIPGVVNVSADDLKEARKLLQAHGIRPKWTGKFFGVRNFQVPRDKLFDAQDILSAKEIRWW